MLGHSLFCLPAVCPGPFRVCVHCPCAPLYRDWHSPLPHLSVRSFACLVYFLSPLAATRYDKAALQLHGAAASAPSQSASQAGEGLASASPAPVAPVSTSALGAAAAPAAAGSAVATSAVTVEAESAAVALSGVSHGAARGTCGEWRNQAVTKKYCSRPGDEDGVLCEHGSETIVAHHWSCCGIPFPEAACAKVGICTARWDVMGSACFAAPLCSHRLPPSAVVFVNPFCCCVLWASLTVFRAPRAMAGAARRWGGSGWNPSRGWAA
jgi:hypothetical protein